jgi:RNA recognition motif-containing protein
MGQQNMYGNPQQQMHPQQQMMMQQQMQYGGQPNLMQGMPQNFFGPNKNTLFNMANMAGLNKQGGASPKKRFEAACCLNVSNLTATTFDNDLFKHFSSKGYKLASVRVIMDHMTSKSKCFGYLNFHSAEEANRCLTEMNATTLDGKQLVLNKKKDTDTDSQANLIVKNLPKEMTQVEFMTFFKEFGDIVSSKLELNSDNSNRG